MHFLFSVITFYVSAAIARGAVPKACLNVQCLVDPCTVTSCPAHPKASCVADYCDGCNARFFDEAGNEVTATCQCLIKGQIFKTCGSNCVATCTNPFPKCTSICVSRCECPFGQVIDDDGKKINECVPIQHCNALAKPKRSACPPGVDLVQCFVDPCRFASCEAFPNAVCVADYCGGCNVKFFDHGIDVTKFCNAA